MRIAMCCFRIKIENQVLTRIFEFDSMVRRENEKSVDSRFLKNVWGIRNLHTRATSLKWSQICDCRLSKVFELPEKSHTLQVISSSN
jgi:hypothetical protein